MAAPDLLEELKTYLDAAERECGELEADPSRGLRIAYEITAAITLRLGALSDAGELPGGDVAARMKALARRHFAIAQRCRN
jgi:hypothetical protein